MKERKDLLDVLGFQNAFLCNMDITKELFLKNDSQWDFMWALMKVATYWYLKGVRAERAYRRTGVKEWALK